MVDSTPPPEVAALLVIVVLTRVIKQGIRYEDLRQITEHLASGQADLELFDLLPASERRRMVARLPDRCRTRIAAAVAARLKAQA
jgi:hypothetical protein